MKDTVINVAEFLFPAGENFDVIPITVDDKQMNLQDEEIPENLPILALRNTVLLPGVVLPIHIGRKKSITLIKSVYKKNKLIGTIAQIDGKKENPKSEDLYKVGTVGYIVKILEMPDGSTSVIIQGRSRFGVSSFISEDPYFVANTFKYDEILPEPNDSEFEAIITSLKESAIKIIELSKSVPPEAAFAIKNIENNSFLINFICSNSDLQTEEKQKLLEISNLKERGIKLLEYLSMEVQKLELKDNIQSKVKQVLDKQQKEYILNQQLKTIQNELGGDTIDLEIEELKKLAKTKKWNKDVKNVFFKELARLQRINPVSPDHSVQLNYLNTLIELPWNEFTKDKFDLPKAQQILDKDHYGLEKAKERILEYLAVLKLKGDLKSPILCFYGPPGVGKTSLGKSIAKALGRKYVRMSLGGLHDESEIRGHRKTYIGALPGRIIQNIKKAKSANPVFVLDEIDKVGNDFRGDPSSALLEVLDPEQNSTFYDNYLELDFDLSKVMFIATANSLADIKPALLDRMELINLTGYLVEEKIEIAKRHLITKQLTEHGVKPAQIHFSDAVIEDIIDNYTRESGVRSLDKRIAKVVRWIAKKIAFKEPYNKQLTVEEIRKILGVPRYIKDKYEGNQFAGIVTGLAWTSFGGEILLVETSLSKGNGKLTLTGNLGNVMKESAILALEYLRAHAWELDLKSELFDCWNVHIHVPEGAIPKDGPSAGITMITSLASAFTQRKVRPHIAMTGEITLRGKILPVGGIKEKILAAKRAGIKEIILSKENEKDLEEVNELYIRGLKFHFVDIITDVLKIALLDEKVDKPINIDVREKPIKRRKKHSTNKLN